MKTFKDEECWLWAYRVDDRDYGQLAYWNGEKAVKQKAHRAIYEALVGPIPDGYTLDHLCRVRRCVNPAHLEPVTNRVNVQRGIIYRLTKTHCKKGHLYSGANLSMRKNGTRICRACANAQQARSYRKLKAIGAN